jgi:perosamine synthetase
MIPIAKPDLTGNEEKYLLDAFRSGFISSQGDYIPRFEEGFAKFIRVA